MTGFVFDPAGVEAVLREWQALRDDLCEDTNLAVELANVVAPGHETASWDMARHAVRSGEAFQRHNMAMVEVVGQYINALTAARDDYLATEAAAGDAYRRR
jgi:hypothetical protein